MIVSNYNKIYPATTLHLIAVAKLFLKEFVLPSISLLNKNTEGNTDIIKRVNILYQNGSLLKDITLILDIYLQPCV